MEALLRCLVGKTARGHRAQNLVTPGVYNDSDYIDMPNVHLLENLPDGSPVKASIRISMLLSTHSGSSETGVRDDGAGGEPAAAAPPVLMPVLYVDPGLQGPGLGVGGMPGMPVDLLLPGAVLGTAGDPHVPPLALRMLQHHHQQQQAVGMGVDTADTVGLGVANAAADGTSTVHVWNPDKRKRATVTATAAAAAVGSCADDSNGVRVAPISIIAATAQLATNIVEMKADTTGSAASAIITQQSLVDAANVLSALTGLSEAVGPPVPSHCSSRSGRSYASASASASAVDAVAMNMNMSEDIKPIILPDGTVTPAPAPLLVTASGRPARSRITPAKQRAATGAAACTAAAIPLVNVNGMALLSPLGGLHAMDPMSLADTPMNLGAPCTPAAAFTAAQVPFVNVAVGGSTQSTIAPGGQGYEFVCVIRPNLMHANLIPGNPQSHPGYPQSQPNQQAAMQQQRDRLLQRQQQQQRDRLLQRQQQQQQQQYQQYQQYQQIQQLQQQQLLQLQHQLNLPIDINASAPASFRTDSLSESLAYDGSRHDSHGGSDAGNSESGDEGGDEDGGDYSEIEAQQHRQLQPK